MLTALGSGIVGATALTAVHETARHLIPHAPRMDVIGGRAITRPLRAAGVRPPRWNRVFWYTLAGEAISNSLYYSLVGIGPRRHAWKRGLLLGLGAGLGAAFLPPVMGLGRQPHRRAPFTQLLTIAWYTVGGLAAAATFRALDAPRRHR